MILLQSFRQLAVIPTTEMTLAASPRALKGSISNYKAGADRAPCTVHRRNRDGFAKRRITERLTKPRVSIDLGEVDRCNEGHECLNGRPKETFSVYCR